jgi:hypothetical protein
METLKAVFFGPDPQAQVSDALLTKNPSRSDNQPSDWPCLDEEVQCSHSPKYTTA